MKSEEMNMEDQELIKINQSWNFKHLALPCAVYALTFAICMYKNWSGITAPLWIASLIALVVYLIHSTGKTLKRGSIFMAATMLVISISCFYTANEAVLFSDYLAEFLLLVTLVLHNCADDAQWNLAKLFHEIIVSSFAAVGRIATPFTDGKAYFELHPQEKRSKAGKVIVGILIAIPTLFILGFLLASADAVFENIFIRVFGEVINLKNIIGILGIFMLGFFSAYCGMRYAQNDGIHIRTNETRKAEPVIAITVTSLVAALYLIFSVIQILFLFIGGFSLPENMTYAEYARSGFFQLLFVSILNLIVVLVLKEFIVKSRILNVILMVICACTYIMIASSAIRMIMYIRAYSLTFQRVSVLFALFLIAVLLAGVIIMIFNDRFSFRPFCIAAACLVYIPFAFLNVDRIIASYNLSFYAPEKTSYTESHDFYYISSLSTDAAPAILEYFEEKGISEDEMVHTGWYVRYCYNNNITGEFPGIRTYNISRHIANKRLAVPGNYETRSYGKQ